MSEKQKRLTANEVIKIISKYGFEKVSQKGSHQKWKHPETKRVIIIPYHKGKSLPIGTLKAIIKDSGLPSDIWN